MDDGVYSFTTVGEWDGSAQNFTRLDTRAIMWHPRLAAEGEAGEGEGEEAGVGEGEEAGVGEGEEAEGEGEGEVGVQGVPGSTCRERCSVGQQAVPTWPRCCWGCQDCRENEHTLVRDGLPACHPCPTGTRSVVASVALSLCCDVSPLSLRVALSLCSVSPLSLRVPPSLLSPQSFNDPFSVCVTPVL